MNLKLSSDFSKTMKIIDKYQMTDHSQHSIGVNSLSSENINNNNNNGNNRYGVNNRSADFDVDMLLVSSENGFVNIGSSSPKNLNNNND